MQHREAGAAIDTTHLSISAAKEKEECADVCVVCRETTATAPVRYESIGTVIQRTLMSTTDARRGDTAPDHLCIDFSITIVQETVHAHSVVMTMHNARSTMHRPATTKGSDTFLAAHVQGVPAPPPPSMSTTWSIDNHRQLDSCH